MIALFAYDFPHRKTQDFMTELFLAGHRDVAVIAAPFRELEVGDKNRYFPTTLQRVPAANTVELAEAFGYPYVSLDHDDRDGIAGFIGKHGCDTAVIAGARIIKRAIIELFPGGIVNFHPGRIPETSGLDAFYYSIRNNVPVGVTAHFIDWRIDAGDLIFFEELEVGLHDTPEIVAANNYTVQIKALRRFLALRRAGDVGTTPANRPTKNSPMTPDEKRACLERFPAWRSTQFLRQQGKRLRLACEKGDVSTAKRLLAEVPELLESRGEQGWTPLIVAAFHGHADIVRVLLDAGASVNLGGLKGTTPLMYAKTRHLHRPDLDRSLLETLIAEGADIERTDSLGKSVIDYVRGDGDEDLGDFLIRTARRHQSAQKEEA